MSTINGDYNLESGANCKLQTNKNPATKKKQTVKHDY